jgi:hypothetical protein
MNGKHDSECTCHDCIAYQEQELQCDIDKWMPPNDDLPQNLCPSYLNEVVSQARTEHTTLYPNEKHASECTCLDCIAYQEQQLQGNVDERMPHHDDMPRITLSSPYIGRRIRKRFCRKWYTGVVTAWDPDEKLYHAKYEDDDSEDLDHNEMHGCLMCFEKHWSQQQLTKKRRCELQRTRRKVSRATKEQLERTQKNTVQRRIRREQLKRRQRNIETQRIRRNVVQTNV